MFRLEHLALIGTGRHETPARAKRMNRAASYSGLIGAPAAVPLSNSPASLCLQPGRAAGLGKITHP
jgi:hypothetical protein